jgi:hypothetical protein
MSATPNKYIDNRSMSVGVRSRGRLCCWEKRKAEILGGKALNAMTRLTIQHPTQHVYNELSFYVDQLAHESKSRTLTNHPTLYGNQHSLAIESSEVDLVRKTAPLEKSRTSYVKQKTSTLTPGLEHTCVSDTMVVRPQQRAL